MRRITASRCLALRFLFVKTLSAKGLGKFKVQSQEAASISSFRRRIWGFGGLGLRELADESFTAYMTLQLRTQVEEILPQLL